MEKQLQPPFDHYTIDEQGVLRSYPRNGTIKEIRIMKGTLDCYGYLIYKLRAGKIQKNVKAHRLVAIAFIPNPDNKPTVNHIDGNKANNNVANLEWSAYKEQIVHSVKNGLQKEFGQKHVIQYDTDGNKIAEFSSIREAAEKTGIKWQNISACFQKAKNRKTAGGFIWKTSND